jgi:hypothetical protein
MSTGAKIAIGCAVVLVLGGVATVVGIVGLGMWAKGKAESFVNEQKKVDDLEKQARAIAFTPPADGVITEPQLLKFLDARKRVFATYEKHKVEIDRLGQVGNSKDKQAGFSDMASGVNLLLEFRAAHAQALVDVGMGQDEYAFLVQSVYKSMWASELEKETGKTIAENKKQVADSLKQAAKGMEQQSEQPIDPSLPPEAQKAMREAQEAMKKSQEDMNKAAEQANEGLSNPALDVPPQNIALFRKHEAEIKKYAMTGLEWLGM